MLGVRSFPLVPSIDKEVATNRLINQWICILLIHRIIFFYVLFFVNLDLWTMDEQLAKDLPIVTSKLTELNTHVTDATSYVNSLLQRVKNDELPTEDGLSFLEMKHHLLLQYIINLTYSMLVKVDGRHIDGSDVIDRLIEIRVVLEKMRPIDKKLKYQVDKLMKMASTDVSTAEKHPLNFKPNIDMLVSKGDEEDDEEEDGEGDQREADDNTGVYVPPKVSAVPYEEEERSSKKSAQKEKMRQRALNSSLLKDLREEYSEEPEEIRDGYRQQRMSKFKEREQERERFEEDNMRRLQQTKKVMQVIRYILLK